MCDSAILHWTRFITVALLLTSQTLLADDKPPISTSDNVQMVPVKVAGGKTAYVPVQKQLNPFRNLTTSDQLSFNKESPLANKQFSPSNNSFSQSDTSFQQQTFLTKSYFSDSKSQTNTTTPNLNTKFSTENSTAYNRSASEFDRSFATSGSDIAQNKKAIFASNTSDYQGQTAVLGSHHVDTFASTTLVAKPYQGPEVDDIKRDLNQVNQGLSRMSGLPSRPLTIDEVRDLINHQTKPNTDSKPEAASKPLNDPDYKPVPMRISPADEDDNKDGLVPSPGTMANPQPPENSEPLPR